MRRIPPILIEGKPSELNSLYTLLRLMCIIAIMFSGV